MVVIPCFNEPDLLGTLDSLAQCVRPPGVTEVITVINHAEGASEAIQQRNQSTLAAAFAWNAKRADLNLIFYFLYHPDLPKRHAGVGLARKLGMDLALARFVQLGRLQGVIVALDADCRVEVNYLQALHDHFQQHPKTPGCSIHFLHPLEGLERYHRQGIAAYELSLRYIVRGWRYCGLPNGFHTVGSAMAVRAEAYRKQGGMNRRQAGEDFYFLQKIMALGGYTALGTTIIFPSPRVSHRVPFGTGRAMAGWMEQQEEVYCVWHPLVFAEPRPFLAMVETLYRGQDVIAGTGSRFERFLVTAGFEERLQEMRAHTASPEAFRKRFFQWFDGFRFLKWAHWATADGLAEIPVEVAAKTVLEWSNQPYAASEVEALLAIYQRLDQSGF